MPKRQFNRSFLELFCKDSNVLYDSIDESINITRDTRLTGKCKNVNCMNKFDKTFRILVEDTGPYCVKCTKENRLSKFRETCIEKYRVEYPSQSEEVRNKSKKTCMERYGTECSLHSEEIRNKVKQTCMERYGVENPFQSEDVKEKFIQTCVKRYGVKYPSQSEKIKDKMKQTCMERYGVEYSSQYEDVKDKMKQTCFEHYGVEYVLQSEEVKEKSKQTCIERYGVENPFQSEDVKDKMKQTCIERYGVEYAIQNSEIAERSSKKAYMIKEYTFPSGKVIKCQGYEPFALDILMTERIIEDDIVTSKKEVPEIWYKDNGKDRRYYVDIFIKSLNKFIEVKSTWTYKKDKEKVELTKNKVKEQGFFYECWVFNSKGTIVEKIL